MLGSHGGPYHRPSLGVTFQRPSAEYLEAGQGLSCLDRLLAVCPGATDNDDDASVVNARDPGSLHGGGRSGSGCQLRGEPIAWQLGREDEQAMALTVQAASQCRRRADASSRRKTLRAAGGGEPHFGQVGDLQLFVQPVNTST